MKAPPDFDFGYDCELHFDSCHYTDECPFHECLGYSDDDDDKYWGYDDDLIDGVGFADPGGNSALRAATKDNPRTYPCPTCGAKNVLTRIDVQRGYQCDRCADRAEGGWGY